MRTWKFFGLLGVSFVTIAGLSALVAIATGNAYFFYIAIIFSVMTAHSSIYAEMLYLGYWGGRNKEADFSSFSGKKKAPKPVAGAT